MRVHSDITTLISRVVSVAELLERSQVMHLSNNLDFRADGCRLVRDNSHVSRLVQDNSPAKPDVLDCSGHVDLKFHHSRRRVLPHKDQTEASPTFLQRPAALWRKNLGS